MKFTIDLEPSCNGIRAIIHEEGQTTRLESLPIDPDNKYERRRAIRNLFENLSYILQRRAYPKDTFIYDVIDDKNGRRLVNPRYPEEENKHGT